VTFTPWRGSPNAASTRHSLVWMPVSVWSLIIIVGTPRDDQINLVGAESEELSKFSELRYLRDASSTLPQVDGLWLDADFQRQFELRPPSCLSKHPNRHHPLSPYST
jgi:hypothetical protein